MSRGWTRVPTHVNTDASNVSICFQEVGLIYVCAIRKGMVIHPEFIHYVSKTWFEGKGRWTSAGGLALIWALHVCNEASSLIIYIIKSLHKVYCKPTFSTMIFNLLIYILTSNKASLSFIN